MAVLDALREEVRLTKAGNDSVLVLIDGLVVKLNEALAANDPVALQALVDELAATRALLASKVMENP